MEALSRGSIRLRPVSKTRWATLRDQTRRHSLAPSEQNLPITPVESELRTDYGSIGTERFRTLAFAPQKPLLMQAGPMFVRSGMAMPAIKKWFDFVPNHGQAHHQTSQRKTGKTMSAYLNSFASTAILPFELAYPQAHRLHGETIHNFIENLRQEGNHDCPNPANLANPLDLAIFLQSQLPPPSETTSEEQTLQDRPGPRPRQRILHFTAPLALLDAAIKFNSERPNAGVEKLYIAQAPLNDLPKELQDDLPVPKIVKLAGKGDIYNSSIWLGLEPTYTPLHRDPNPNLFIQLCGNKVVRLLSPDTGDQLFRDVQLRLGHMLDVNSRLRGPEMMDGPERDLMFKAVWSRDGLRDRQAQQGMVAEDQGLYRSQMQEARLQPGDALFIPKGWWHSVASEGDSGGLNASVNWWFR